MTYRSATPERVVALDVGGANLKAADGLGWSASMPFRLWERAAGLADALVALVTPRAPQRLVATMTGEIADCFPSRAAGVDHIVTSLMTAATACAADLRIYLVDGSHHATLALPGEARASPLAAAAANWHALARLAAAQAPTERTFLIDIGSTTTDIVPLHAGRPLPLARHDADRMLSGELVYTGVERTPLAALVRRLPHAGLRRPVAAERFADTRDAWLLLGRLPEEPGSRDTADGGPATRAAARIRLARCMLLDPESLTETQALVAAGRCANAQRRRIAAARERVARGGRGQPTGVGRTGPGAGLAADAVEALGWRPAIVALADALGDEVSRSAPAHALARIARGLLA